MMHSFIASGCEETPHATYSRIYPVFTMRDITSYTSSLLEPEMPDVIIYLELACSAPPRSPHTYVNSQPSIDISMRI